MAFYRCWAVVLPAVGGLGGGLDCHAAPHSPLSGWKNGSHRHEYEAFF